MHPPVNNARFRIMRKSSKALNDTFRLYKRSNHEPDRALDRHWDFIFGSKRDPSGFGSTPKPLFREKKKTPFETLRDELNNDKWHRCRDYVSQRIRKMHQARKKQKDLWNSPNIKITNNDWKCFKCCSPVHAWLHIGLGVTCNNMYFKALFIEPQGFNAASLTNIYTEGEKRQFAAPLPHFEVQHWFLRMQRHAAWQPFQHRSKRDLTLRCMGLLRKNTDR